MKRSRKALSSLAFVLTICMFMGAEQAESPQEHEHHFPFVKPPAGFDRLARLAGRWEGTSDMPDGKKDMVIEYQLTSAGTVLIERLALGEPHEMFSIYHGDGDNILMTHYCALGNQPRMQLEKGDDPNVLKFVFKDGTSMDIKDPHMHQLTMTLVDDDTLRHEWVHFVGGQQKDVVRMELKRKK